MTEGKWRRLEWWGIPLILSAMIGLHYGYRLSGGAMWSILFGSVNESAWEHVKALLLPYLAWAAIEWCAVRVPLRRMAVAKAAGAFLMAGVFISLYFLEFLIPKGMASFMRIHRGHIGPNPFGTDDGYWTKNRGLGGCGSFLSGPFGRYVFGFYCKSAKNHFIPRS